MDGASLTRLRWRLHGAWMWPTFIALTLADGLWAHLEPLAGDSQTVVGGWLVGAFLNLVGIVLLAPVLGAVLHRLRRDMPKVVARDYAGTTAVVAVSAGLLAVGLVHHSTVSADQRALTDAVGRAQAFIGAHAPDEFRSNLGTVDTYAIQAPTSYRICVSNRSGTRSYCVVVDRSKPFPGGVSPAGSEPNQTLALDTW